MSELSGMTGFARVIGGEGDNDWVWEVKSVNGKGLDVRVRMPSEFTELELRLKKLFARYFARGNMQLHLSLGQGLSGESYSINTALIDEVSAFLRERGESVDYSQLLQIRGAITERKSRLSDEERKGLYKGLMDSAKILCETLKAARLEEGAALEAVMESAVKEMEILVVRAENLAAAAPKALRDKLQQRLEALEADGISKDRIAQEIALAAQKVDVREELDRLKLHCKQARKLLTQGSPVGRKLDFLAQEFNREANTLCSKSSDPELTQVGLDLKNTIEQFREQAANVE